MKDEDQIRAWLRSAEAQYEPGYNDVGNEPWYDTDYVTMIKTLRWVLDEDTTIEQ